MKQKSGTKFKSLESKLSKEPGIYNPAGLAASIGRNKLGKKKMEAKAVAGKKKHTKSK